MVTARSGRTRPASGWYTATALRAAPSWVTSQIDIQPGTASATRTTGQGSPGAISGRTSSASSGSRTGRPRVARAVAAASTNAAKAFGARRLGRRRFVEQLDEPSCRAGFGPGRLAELVCAAVEAVGVDDRGCPQLVRSAGGGLQHVAPLVGAELSEDHVELLAQHVEHPRFHRAFADEIEGPHDPLLADAVDAADALLQPGRRPGQVPV